MATTKKHEQRQTLHQDVVYPDHVERTTSKEFRHNRHTLVDQLDLPCWICGSREKREVHHLHEWALWNSLDPSKVLNTLRCFDPYGFTKNNPSEPVESPDDIRNLLVLCGEHSQDGKTIPGGHHRGVDIGIHTITFPIWLSIRAKKDGIDIVDPVDVRK